MVGFNISQKIIHRLMLESHFVSDLGLFYGKMGIAMFFFEYGRYKENEVYTDFGGELLDDIWEQIHNELPLSFASGLSGIGWGIEYLLQNHFLEGNANDICVEIDKKIMQTNLLRLDDKSLDTGLEGLFYYVSARMQGSISQNCILPFDTDFFEDFSHILPDFEINDLNNFFSCYPVVCNNFVNPLLVTDSNYLTLPLGLNDGVAGYLLNQIM